MKPNSILPNLLLCIILMLSHCPDLQNNLSIFCHFREYIESVLYQIKQECLESTSPKKLAFWNEIF